MADPKLGPASRKLLRIIARYDQGDGVVFQSQPRNNWRLLTNGDTFNGRTFWPLDSHGLVDVGDARGDGPVKITQAGREYLAREDTP